MRVIALTLQGFDLRSLNSYRDNLMELLRRAETELAVLPAYSSLVLGAESNSLPLPGNMEQIIADAPAIAKSWTARFLDLHASLAFKLKLYLVPGTWFVREEGKNYHRTCCIDPAGRIIQYQDQTHLTRQERDAGLSRGERLGLFTCGTLQAGLLIGNDARHPETGRSLALRGADLVLHCGAMPLGVNCWSQAAGIWSQVQQNQFWAVEAQLCGKLEGNTFRAEPIIHGPCEITPGQNGYLARGSVKSPYVSAYLKQSDRLALIERYPLLDMLNAAAFGEI